MRAEIHGEDLVTLARGWVGTPFHHAARVKGVGADCVGLLIGVAREAGVPGAAGYEPAPYGRVVNPEVLRAELLRFCDPVPVDAAWPGDVLVFSVRGSAQHVGLFTGGDPPGVVHACDKTGRVVEHRLCPPLSGRIVECLRLRLREGDGDAA